MLLRILLVLAFTVAATASETVAELGRAIRDAGLDSDECYRVRELSFNKQDLKFYFTDGFLIFSKPVNGRRLSAVFSSDVEGGEAEVMLLPPTRSERQSLGSFTGSPNLSEHFRGALFVFTDRTADELMSRAREVGRKTPERGLLLAQQYGSVLRNISDSFQMRLVQDLLNPESETPLFFGAIAGINLGNFDVFYDSDSREQIVVGQLGNRNNVPRYDIWTSFEARNIRNGTAKLPKQPFAITNYRIEAVLDEQLHLTAVTKFQLTPARRMRSFPLELSRRMKLTEVRLNGQTAETFERESLRTNALRGTSDFFLFIAPEALEPGKSYEVEFHHDGDVVFNAGNGVYAVSDRGTWYPHRGADFTLYDLTFRYPKRLTLISTGELMDERTEGDMHVSHRKTSGPVRFAGFNLGTFEKISMKSGPYTIDVYGNRTAEPGLQDRAGLTPPVPPSLRRRNTDILLPEAPPQPLARLVPLAEEVTAAFEYMTKQFGPPPLKTLAVTPIPGAFGQGFPGLVYLSTLTYLAPEQRPLVVREKTRQVFFSDLLAPHEVAHQWWGNVVSGDAYQDSWLMESLANYSALLYLEKRKGVRARDAVLDEFRTRLLGKRADGGTVESLGPITWGPRVESSDGMSARLIVYEKGAWILHMLRLRMGDERFLKMLGEVCRRYQFKALNTDAFRSLAEEFMPPPQRSLENFFENWIYGTGIPTLKVSSSIKGKAPALKVTVTVAQSDVDEDFSVDVPVEVQFGGGPPVVKWVRTASEPVSITIAATRLPTKVSVPSFSVLAKH